MVMPALGKLRDLPWQHSKNKAIKSRIKPDRPMTKKARHPDQVKEERYETGSQEIPSPSNKYSTPLEQL